MPKHKAKYNYINMPSVQEIAERFKDFFAFKFVDGILEVRMSTKGGPAVWSYQFHHALGELWTAIGHCKDVEVLILTSTGENWLGDVDPGSFKEVEESPDDDQRFDCQIYDTLKITENFIFDLEIPTITAVNGPGGHWEFAMLSDIAICSPDFVLFDNHFGMSGGHVPGDGMALCLQAVLGVKRGNYMMYSCKGIDAQQCLEMGAVNEVVEKEKVLDRAWEIARDIMKSSRSCRRLTHYMCVRPWRDVFERDLRIHVLSEMYSFNLSKTEHDFEEIAPNEDGCYK